jgi:hypothetical protein
MKIVLLVEGATEKVFIPYLRRFLETRVKNMPKLLARKYDGRIPSHDKLKRIVEINLSGKDAADYVIALTDVYTGSNPPDFTNADDARQKMKAWVGDEPRFFPHAAQYDFEAWLLPYWEIIQKIAHHNMACPGNNPETVNHQKPPAYRIKEIFEKGKCRDSYIKPRDAGRILGETKDNLLTAVNSCSELKALVNTILKLCGEDAI